MVQAEPDLKLLEKPLLKRSTLPSLPVEQARPESTQTQQQAQTTSNKQEQQQLRGVFSLSLSSTGASDSKLIVLYEHRSL